MRKAIFALVIGLCSCTQASNTKIPPNYPASYAHTIEDADREGSLDIWSAIGKTKTNSLVVDFRRHYPGIQVTYVELPARQLYQQFLARAKRGEKTADFLWSAAMDLQIKLVNDGYTQRYVSPERDALPHWANWKNQAWGTTAEPIVFLYNRNLVAENMVPQSHVALMNLLESDPAALPGGVAVYDVPRSAVGYLYLSQDQQATHDIWRLVRAMGNSGAKVYPSAEDVVGAVVDGKAALAYDIVGSYALGQAERNSDLGMVIPRDYTLVMSRIAVIPAAARHPNAARLFLDFVLSRRGQQHLAQREMPPVRGDVNGPAALNPRGAPLRAIRVGPALLVTQDQLTRQYFLERWNEAIPIKAGAAPSPNTSGTR